MKPLRQLTPARAQRLIALDRAGPDGLTPTAAEVANYAALSTLGWADRVTIAPPARGWRFTLNDTGRGILAAAKKGNTP